MDSNDKSKYRSELYAIWQLFPTIQLIHWSNSLLTGPKLSVTTQHDLVTVTIQWGCGAHCDNGSLARVLITCYRSQVSWINISDDMWCLGWWWHVMPGLMMTHYTGCLLLTKYARWLVQPIPHHIPRHSSQPEVSFNCSPSLDAGPGFNISGPSSSYSLWTHNYCHNYLPQLAPSPCVRLTAEIHFCTLRNHKSIIYVHIVGVTQVTCGMGSKTNMGADAKVKWTIPITMHPYAHLELYI